LFRYVAQIREKETMSFLIKKYAFRDGCCNAHHGTAGDKQTVTFTGPCYSCQEPQSVTVAASDAAKFQQGGFAQDCFPYLTADQREFLISGICNKCWDDMFKEDDEADDA
jgi:hypothetical protein